MNDLKTIKLDAKNVSTSADGVKLLMDVSLSVLPGELVGLLGPSGAGKSTLLKAINGFSKPDEGKVLLNKEDIYDNFDKFRNLIGYVPQDDIVHESLTVTKALYYSALLRLPESSKENRIQERVKKVIEILDLAQREKTRIRKLSGGQRKRVSLGIELLTSPPLLFLDEPTSGLDPGLEEKMMKLFKKFSQEGRSIIITTHVTKNISLLDMAAILDRGGLVFFGPPETALKYFQVADFTQIYGKLSNYKPGELSRKFRHSSLYNKYVSDRIALKRTVAIPKPEKTSSEDQEEGILDPKEKLERLKRKLGMKGTGNGTME